MNSSGFTRPDGSATCFRLVEIRSRPSKGRFSALFAGLAAFAVAFVPIWLPGAAAAPQHGIAMHGAPALAPGFTHLPYASPDAPKGGTLVLNRNGSFDSFNPYTLKGNAARGLNFVFEPLMARSPDEPFTLYGLIAERIETPPDRSWVEFTLNPAARFQDGEPVTVEDVAFSLETLRDKGRPNHRSYYGNVARVEFPGPGRIRFVFAPGENWELPLIIGLMPVLPKHYYAEGRFERADLSPPLGSGPYKLAGFEAGRWVTYTRDPAYWGRGLPVNAGRYNFDRIRYDYFRDKSVAFEAFKKGLIDVWFETEPADWHQNFDFPAVAQGRVTRLESPHGRAEGMFGFAFNTRRDLFRDPRVREALTLAFDFEWINRVFYFGAYRRMASFFDNSELAARGPASAAERALLAGFPGSAEPEILAQGYRPPVSDESGTNRSNLLRAVSLLEAAGWTFDGPRLVERGSGRPFSFEIIVLRREDVRLALAYRHWLTRLGIEVFVRRVDSAQYIQRTETYDFDMILNTWGASLSPGNEQKFYWSTDSAERPGTRNYPGIRSEAVDFLIERLVAARTRAELIAATRALDRVLLSGRYVVPLFYLPFDAIAYWPSVAPSPRPALYGAEISAWWAAGAAPQEASE